MGGETLLKGDYQKDPELQQKPNEGVLQWMQRVDAIMFGREAIARVETNTGMTTYMSSMQGEAGYQAPDETPDQTVTEVREESSGLLDLSNITA